MDEREFRDQMVRLAEPVAATPKAVAAIGQRIDAKRRNRLIGIAATVALVIAVSGFATVRLTHPDHTDLDPVGAHEVTMEAFSFPPGGIYLRMSTTFEEKRTITGYGVVRAGSVVQTHGSVWADGVSINAEDPYPFIVPAGTRVSIEGPIEAPDCDAPAPDDFSFTIRSNENGQQTEDTFIASNPEAYEPAFAEWCERDHRSPTR